LDLLVPGRDFGFQELMNSQASGDAKVLAENGRPVLTLSFKNQVDALALICKTIESL
jgi:glucose-6-phosphate isomerase